MQPYEQTNIKPDTMHTHTHTHTINQSINLYLFTIVQDNYIHRIYKIKLMYKHGLEKGKGLEITCNYIRVCIRGLIGTMDR